MHRFKPVSVALPGVSFGTGSNEGTVIAPSPGGWTGFIQTASGFSNGIANYGTLYDMYYADTLYPGNFGCQSGVLCMTGIWAGIGGYDTTSFIGTVEGDLFQSGFAILGNGNGFSFEAPFSGPGTYLFFEFTPPGQTKFTPQIVTDFPPNDSPAPGDEMGLWGGPLDRRGAS